MDNEIADKLDARIDRRIQADAQLDRWRREIGMAASHLLTVSFGGHPMDEMCGKILTEVRDHLSEELGKIAETKLKAAQESSATAAPVKKAKRK